MEMTTSLHPHPARAPLLRHTLSAFLLLGLGILALGGCAGSSTASGPETPQFTKDADGVAITIPSKAPQRIVSLGAVDSEILAALNVTSRVIAVDYYTDYPAAMVAKPKISDANATYNVEAIVADQPDLVLSFGAETAQVDQKLRAAHLTVVDLPATDLSGSLKEMLLIGQLTHAESAANTLVNSLQQRINAVKQKVAGTTPVSVYMEVGYTPPPPFAFGGGSFGNDILTDAGGANIFASNTTNSGYPQVSDESIIAANPQVILLTEDPRYGGNPALVAQRPGWSGIAAVKNNRVYQINSDWVQRPGPRMVLALEEIAKLLHPDRFA